MHCGVPTLGIGWAILQPRSTWGCNARKTLAWEKAIARADGLSNCEQPIEIHEPWRRVQEHMRQHFREWNIMMS